MQYPLSRKVNSIKQWNLVRIEYNVVNVFLEKLCTQYGGESIHRSFSKKPKLGNFWELVQYNL